MENGYITLEDAEAMLNDAYDAVSVLEASKEEADARAESGRYRRELDNDYFSKNPDSPRLKGKKYQSSNHDPKGSEYEKYRKDIRKRYSNSSSGWGSGDKRGKKLTNYNLDKRKDVRSHVVGADKDSSIYFSISKQPSKEYDEVQDRERKLRDKYYKKWKNISDNYDIAHNKREADEIRANGKKATHPETYDRVRDKYIDKRAQSINREHEAFKKLQVADGLIQKVKSGKITGPAAEKIKKRYADDFKESVDILRESTMNAYSNNEISIDELSNNLAYLEYCEDQFYDL